MASPLIYLAVSIVGGLVFAVAGSSPPDLQGLAALITAGVGVIAFLASLFRGKRSSKRFEEVEEAASYVKGFDALIKRLQEEIEDLHSEIATERSKWAQEKAELLSIIRELRNDLQQSVVDKSTTKSQLMELRGQIRGFLTSDQYEEFTKHL